MSGLAVTVPVLRCIMIYLDNAATTYPKPPAVVSAVSRCMQEYGGNPGRGSHRLAMLAAECVYACREMAAQFFGVDDPTKVVFTLNTTFALNTAIKSIACPGDHFLIGNMEHNSVLRPIERLARDGVIDYDIFDVRGAPCDVVKRLAKLVRPNTRAVVCAHASNVCNISAPIQPIAEFCHARGIALIVDGAQSAGVLPIDLAQTPVDFLCVPGHKGLYGPQGCGLMIVNEGLRCLQTLVEGGSGIHSLDRDMPQELPERFEAGTLPTPAIAGLCEGIRWVTKTGSESIHSHECDLWMRLYSDLSSMNCVRIYDDTPGPILLFNVDSVPPSVIAAELNRAGICVRPGLHCAPLAHQMLNTGKDGAVRVSFGAMNTAKEVKRFADVLYKIILANNNPLQ